ncbi:hypothetical protein T4C_386, partial [Trichinella pseudospiralis]
LKSFIKMMMTTSLRLLKQSQLLPNTFSIYQKRSLYNYSLKTNGRTSSPGNLLFIFQASLQQIHYYIANIILKNEASIEEFFGSLFFYHINMTLRLETFGLFNLKLLHLFYDESELNFCKKNFFAASINLE